MEPRLLQRKVSKSSLLKVNGYCHSSPTNKDTVNKDTKERKGKRKTEELCVWRLVIAPAKCNYLISFVETDEFSALTKLLIPKSPTTLEEKQVPHESQKPHISLAIRETKAIAKIAMPMVLTSLLLYCRSMISLLFLGRLEELALAGGSLALGFANITGYSILSGLAMGMEPICGQAFGAKRHTLLGLCLQRTVLLLIFSSIPISLLWLYTKNILLFCGQNEAIATQATDNPGSHKGYRRKRSDRTKSITRESSNT